jgi:hypothetical protein
VNTRLIISILIDGTVTEESARAILQNIIDGTPFALGGMIQDFRYSENVDAEDRRKEYERFTGRCYACGKDIGHACTCIKRNM